VALQNSNNNNNIIIINNNNKNNNKAGQSPTCSPLGMDKRDCAFLT